MSATAQQRTLVIGGSLAGLLHGVTLRAAGWEVDVFERTPHPLCGRGGGIVLQPEVVRVLELAGHTRDTPLGVEARERIYLDRSGRVLERLHVRQLLSSWSLIYELLRQATPPQHYHLGAQLVEIDSGPDAVTAVFADGRRERGALLVGADGVNSTVRALMLPQVRPGYAGYVAWRGLVPEGELAASTAALLAERFVFHQFPGSHILQYLIPAPDGSVRRGERSHNWVWYRNVPEPELQALLTDREGRRRTTSVPPGLVREQAIEELRQAARETLAPQMAELVLATREPFIQTILDLAVPRMVFGRVLLSGDAAFVPRPHTAASTSKAATNALALATELRHGAQAQPQAALQAWEQDQLQLGAALYRHGRALGDRSQFPERFPE